MILPIEKAVVDINNIEYAYGYGVYETVKVRKNILYFVDQHVERLLQSARLIELEHIFTPGKVRTAIEGLVQYADVEAANIKIMLIGGRTKETATLYIFLTSPLYPDRKLYKYGAETKTYSYERWMPNAKTLNMLPSYLIYRKASEAGCYDGLLVDKDGCIREGTRTNFYTIKGRVVYSPPAEKILEGVTRDTILGVLSENGFTFEEKDIPLSSVSEYDGAFLSSTSTKIIPLKKIDDTELVIPEELRELMKLYDNFLDTCSGIFNHTK